MMIYQRKIYNENGQLSESVEYKDGKINGLREYYYDNGQLYSKGSYRDGKKEGLWEYFNKDGLVNTEKTGTYKDGKLVE